MFPSELLRHHRQRLPEVPHGHRLGLERRDPHGPQVLRDPRALLQSRGRGCVLEGCGYVHTRVRVNPAASHLTKCFRGGVKLVDELTEISGDHLKFEAPRAMARGTRRQGGAHNYGATGTPQKNHTECVTKKWAS